MKRFSNTVIYTLIILILLICLVGCDKVPNETQPIHTEPSAVATTAPTQPTTTPTTEPATTPTTEPAPTEPVSVQPGMPEVGTESRQLSAEEIQVFADFFYPGGDVTMWYNHALLSRYSSPADLHVLSFFHSCPMEELTAEDHAFYGEAPGFLHKYSIPFMDEKLTLCFGITLDKFNGIGMEELVYNEAGQCYYHDHGDAIFAQPKFFEGYVHPDGTVQLYYKGFQEYQGDWDDMPHVVTLKYVGENGVNHWHILSNVKAE